MTKQTIAQAAVAVLQKAKQPLTAAEITQVILDEKLYSFNTNDQRAMVRGAIERRCEGVDRRNAVSEKLFKKYPDGKYALKEKKST